MPTPHEENPRPWQPTPRRPRRYRDPEHRALRNGLNIAFMVAAIATVVLYYALPGEPNRFWFIGMGMVAVAIKMIEVVIRTLGYTRRRLPGQRDNERDD